MRIKGKGCTFFSFPYVYFDITVYHLVFYVVQIAITSISKLVK